MMRCFHETFDKENKIPVVCDMFLHLPYIIIRLNRHVVSSVEANIILFSDFIQISTYYRDKFTFIICRITKSKAKIMNNAISPPKTLKVKI